MRSRDGVILRSIESDFFYLTSFSSSFICTYFLFPFFFNFSLLCSISFFIVFSHCSSGFFFFFAFFSILLTFYFVFFFFSIFFYRVCFLSSFVRGEKNIDNTTWFKRERIRFLTKLQREKEKEKRKTRFSDSSYCDSFYIVVYGKSHSIVLGFYLCELSIVYLSTTFTKKRRTTQFLYRLLSHSSLIC